MHNEVEDRDMYTVSLVLDSGDIYHFFALSDGVHWAHSSQFKGNYLRAVKEEMKRANAKIVAIDELRDLNNVE